MFGTNEVKKPVQAEAAKAEVKAEPSEAEPSKADTPMTDDERKAARKASAQKMMEHKKAAIKTLVEFAKRMNPDGKDAAVKEAADYLSGERVRSGNAAAKTSVLDEIFKDSKTVKAVDIFMNFEKGRAEMITLCKRAEKKGIIIEYDEKNKTYTRK